MITHKNILSVLFLSLIIISGCSDNPVAPNVTLNNDFNIKYGESVYIPEENISITFEEVVEDSRCPLGVMCFWEGTAEIKLMIRQRNEELIDTVQTYLPQKIISIGEINNSYLFQVKKVEPYPKWKETIDKSDYILTLNVSHFTYGFPDSEIKDKTGIFGQAFIWPISPVEAIGQIDYRSFETSFKVAGNGNDTTLIQTDSTGRFLKYLPAGEYKIVPQKKFPLLIDYTTYTVTENKMTFIKIVYDSGIR